MKESTKIHNHTHKLIYNHRNNTHNIYNIFCTYQNNPIKAVQLIYWIYVDKNRILKQVTCFISKYYKQLYFIQLRYDLKLNFSDIMKHLRDFLNEGKDTLILTLSHI